MSSALADPSDPADHASSVDQTDGSAFDSVSDTDLIERAKSGDASAYAGLWRRHAAAGRTVARSFTSSLDPDDLVSEAFTRIYQQLQKGKGPTGAFRPYLFTTIRNTASSWGRARREATLDTLESFEDPETNEQASLDALDRSLTATAFRSLPTRWQEALWYSEVEAMTPQQIGPLLGMSANSVAALCYRAREGLRRGWIQAHLNSADTSAECRFTIERLGSYARGGLGQRETQRVELHLDGCAKCTIVVAEAKEVGSRLALVLLPLAAGIGGAAAYTTWLQTGATDAVMAAGMPASVTGGAAVVGANAAGSTTAGTTTAGSTATAGSTTAGGTTAGATTAGAGAGSAATVASGVGTGVALTSAGVVTAVVGTLALAATVVVAVTLGPTLFPGTPADPEAVVAAPDVTPNNDEPGSITPPTIETPVPVVPPVVPSPPVEDSPAPDRGIDGSPPVSTDPGPSAAVPDVADPVAPGVPVDPDPPVDPEVPVDPEPPVDPEEPVDSVPSIPHIGPIDNGGGLYFPSIEGDAVPGSVMEFFVRPVSPPGQSPVAMALDVVPQGAIDPQELGEPSLLVEVGESGSWSAAFDMLGAGSYAVTARERHGDSVSGISEPQTFEILPPPQIERFALVFLRLSGAANAGVEVRSLSAESSWSVVLDEGGQRYWWPSFESLFTGDELTVRYSDGSGRFGLEYRYTLPPILPE